MLCRLEEYVPTHLSEDLSVEELCQVLSVSRSALYRLFPEGGDWGVASFVRRCRMEEAYRLVRTTNLSAGEISLAVGFRDEAYFAGRFASISEGAFGRCENPGDKKWEKSMGTFSFALTNAGEYAMI